MMFRRSAQSAVPSSGRATPRGGTHALRVGARALPLAAATSLLALAAPGVPAAVHAGTARAVPLLSHPILTGKARPAPLTTSKCLTSVGIRCYTPLQYRTAYNLNPLYAHGITGKGRTIVIVDSFGSPTIRNDIHVFDKQFGFPDPDLRIVRRERSRRSTQPTRPWSAGPRRPRSTSSTRTRSRPGAKIVLVETPVAETEGVTGFPEMMNAEQTLIDQRRRRRDLAELRRDGEHLPRLRPGQLLQPAEPAVRVQGRAGAPRHRARRVRRRRRDQRRDRRRARSTRIRVNSWPSSDPLVTSVGGSQLYLDDAGNRRAARLGVERRLRRGRRRRVRGLRPPASRRACAASSASTAARRTSA